ISDIGLALLIIAIAIAGKIIGCSIGGILGGMPRWEALAVGVGMSARGAVGMVVAKIGLDLGVIGPGLFLVFVGMAFFTSFLAPLMLRAMAAKLPLSEEEKLRERGESAGFVPSGRLKILVLAGGGENAVLGSHLAAHQCRSDGDRCTILHVAGEC